MAVDIIHDFTGRGETSSRSVRARPVPVRPGAGEAIPTVSPPAGKQDFSQLMKDFVGDVNAMQFKSAHAIDQFVTGEAADVHQVMVAVEEAGIALDLMLEIRNRVMEGYQELIRMQV